jgi:xanthine dehydrogenase iron-sulfur cluster and FAD-binding subunit A
MTIWKHYHFAQFPIDTLKALDRALVNARMIAGGTDLLLDLPQDHRSPVDTVVGINLVTEITILEFCQEKL